MKQGYSLYMNCDEMPLSIFIDVLVNNNKKALIKHGNIDDEYILNAIWDDVFSEYCVLINSVEYRKALQLSKEIGALQSRFLATKAAVSVLLTKKSDRSIEVLKKLGYNRTFSDESMNSDIDFINEKSKSIEILLLQAANNYDKLLKSNENISKRNFIQILIEMSKYIGYHISAERISVLEYAILYNRIKEESVKNSISHDTPKS